MNTARCAPLLLAIFLGGCATKTPDVATSFQGGTGLRTDLIVDNLLDPGQPGREMLWLNASRVFKNQSRYSYYLEVTYAATAETGFLDIAPGPSLVIVVDGKEMRLAGNGSQHLRSSKGGLLNETALYLVEPAQLRAIATARKVTVRVTGGNGVVVRGFKPVNSERFRKFVTKFVIEK